MGYDREALFGCDDDDAPGMGIGIGADEEDTVVASWRTMRRSTMMLALRTVRLASADWMWTGIETWSCGPIGVRGAWTVYRMRGARGLLVSCRKKGVLLLLDDGYGA